jgi:hypothetical protein
MIPALTRLNLVIASGGAPTSCSSLVSAARFSDAGNQKRRIISYRKCQCRCDQHIEFLLVPLQPLSLRSPRLLTGHWQPEPLRPSTDQRQTVITDETSFRGRPSRSPPFGGFFVSGPRQPKWTTHLSSVSPTRTASAARHLRQGGTFQSRPCRHSGPFIKIDCRAILSESSPPKSCTLQSLGTKAGFRFAFIQKTKMCLLRCSAGAFFLKGWEPESTRPALNWGCRTTRPHGPPRN